MRIKPADDYIAASVHNRLLSIAGTAFVFAVLQAYNVLRGNDNATMVYAYPRARARVCVPLSWRNTLLAAHPARHARVSFLESACLHFRAFARRYVTH